MLSRAARARWGGGAAAGQADDRAAGVGVPVRRAETGERGDEINAAVVGDAGSECFDVGGMRDQAEAVAEPLHDGAGDEDAAFQGVFERLVGAETPGDGREQLMFRDDGFLAGVEEQETARAVRVFGEAGAETRLAEECGLLVAGDAADRNAAEGGDRFDMAVDFTAGADLGKNRARDPEDAEEFIIPRAGAEIEQERAGSVGDIGGVDFSAGELPQQPGVDRAEGEFAASGASAGAGKVIEQPGEFGAAEIRIEEQAGFAAEKRLESAAFEPGAKFGGAAILPDDRAMKRAAGGSFPEQRGFALIGQADGGEIGPGEIGFGDGGERGAAGGFPEIGGIVFDPAGLRKMLGELLAGGALSVTLMVEYDGSGGSRALIEREDEFPAHGVTEALAWSVGRQVRPRWWRSDRRGCRLAAEKRVGVIRRCPCGGWRLPFPGEPNPVLRVRPCQTLLFPS